MNEQRLIDANALYEAVEKINHVDYGSMFSYEAHGAAKDVLSDVKRMIDNAPTVHAVDVMKVVLCDKCAIWGDCRIQKMWNVPRGFYCACGKPIEKEKSDYTGDVTEMIDGRKSHE